MSNRTGRVNRTVRAHILKLFKLGLIRAKVFPGHRFRWSEKVGGEIRPTAGGMGKRRRGFSAPTIELREPPRDQRYQSIR